MDQQLVNNQITSMRKKVKLAKSQVYQKLFKKINKIQKNIAKWETISGVDNEKKKKRLNDLKKKLKSKQNDAAEMKKIMPDTISKAALMHNQDYFNSIMNDTNISLNDRLVGLICRHKLIQSMVEKFKNDNPDCDKWLPIQIELWEHKRNSKGKNRKKLDLKNKTNLANKSNILKKQNKIENKSPIKVEKMDNKTPKSVQVKTPSKSVHVNSPVVSKSSSITKSSKVYTPKFIVSKIENENEKLLNMNGDQDNVADIQFKSSSKKALIKRIDLNNSFPTDKIIDNDQEKNLDTNHNKNKTIKRIKDDEFFLTADQDAEEHPDIIKLKKIEKPIFSPKQCNESPSKSFSNSPKFRKDLKNFNPNFKNQNYNKTPRRYFNAGNDNQSGSKNQKTNTESLHPSWKAKMQTNAKQRVSLGSAKSKPNTHIKFD